MMQRGATSPTPIQFSSLKGIRGLSGLLTCLVKGANLARFAVSFHRPTAHWLMIGVAPLSAELLTPDGFQRCGYFWNNCNGRLNSEPGGETKHGPGIPAQPGAFVADLPYRMGAGQDWIFEYDRARGSFSAQPPGVRTWRKLYDRLPPDPPLMPTLLLFEDCKNKPIVVRMLS